LPNSAGASSQSCAPCQQPGPTFRGMVRVLNWPIATTCGPGLSARARGTKQNWRERRHPAFVTGALQCIRHKNPGARRTYAHQPTQPRDALRREFDAVVTELDQSRPGSKLTTDFYRRIGECVFEAAYLALQDSADADGTKEPRAPPACMWCRPESRSCGMSDDSATRR
jgi:hypothetical protein